MRVIMSISVDVAQAMDAVQFLPSVKQLNDKIMTFMVFMKLVCL